MYRTLVQQRALVGAALAVATGLLLFGLQFMATQPAQAASSLFGGAVQTGGYVALVSDGSNVPTGDDYSGINFDDADGTIFSTLSTLSTDYDVTDDQCGGGSPRFQIEVDTNADTVSDGNVFVYIGPSPSFTGCALGWQSTGNLIGNEDAGRWDYTQLGGPLGGYSSAPANVQNGTILGISLVVDGSWSAAASGGDSEQTVNVDNVAINTQTYPFNPQMVTVTIVKNIEGEPATALSANNASFPMSATWDAENIGAGTGSYNLDTAGSYQAQTTNMSQGADYATNEITGGDVVGATCEEGKPFALAGYSTGETLEEAQAATSTTESPSFTDLQTSKYVIVWNDDCSQPDTVNVTINKYIDGTQATTETADGATFPFIADYSANVGTGSDPYTIGPVGNNSANPYEAVTLDFEPGADYATHEVTDQETVGATCEEDKPFALSGYTWGNTPEEAQGGVATTTAPAFTDLQNNKYVIVWNVTCDEPTPPTSVKVVITKYIDGMLASSTASSSPSFPMSATWDAENIGAGTGEYALSATGYNSPNAYQAITSDMTPGADYTTNEVLGGSTVGTTCSTSSQPYALVGYTSGNTMEAALAASSTATTTAPNFTNLQNDKYVIVWNKTCSESGTIGGDVVGGNGVLAVTSIDAVDTTATADGSYENGWKYIFHITVPTNESNIAMKFSDWTSASSTFATANNMRISSPQADNGGATITVTAANTYTTPNLHMTTDLDGLMAGIQVEVTVEVRIPTGTPNASYTTNYGVKSE